MTDGWSSMAKNARRRMRDGSMSGYALQEQGDEDAGINLVSWLMIERERDYC